jgi:hypothetical protein
MFLTMPKCLKPCLSALCLAGVLWWGVAQAATPAPKSSVTGIAVSVEKEPDAVVAELFTSQGCASCPPADAFLGELANRADVITLEMHVDYWDDTKTMFSGTWKDPFSSPVWSRRQQNYNRVLLNSDKVFTPQIVIDGRFQDVGTRRQSVFREIEQAKALRRRHFKIIPALSATGDLKVTVDGPGLKNPANVLLLRIARKAVTKVTGGENNGATLHNRNIVTDIMTLGTYAGGKESYGIQGGVKGDRPLGNDTCAVMLQDPDNMQILSAGFCSL